MQWEGTGQLATTFPLTPCPICEFDAQQIIGVRYTSIVLFIFIHYDSDSEVEDIHIVSSYRRTVSDLSSEETSGWSSLPEQWNQSSGDVRQGFM